MDVRQPAHVGLLQAPPPSLLLMPNPPPSRWLPPGHPPPSPQVSSSFHVRSNEVCSLNNTPSPPGRAQHDGARRAALVGCRRCWCSCRCCRRFKGSISQAAASTDTEPCPSSLLSGCRPDWDRGVCASGRPRLPSHHPAGPLARASFGGGAALRPGALALCLAVTGQRRRQPGRQPCGGAAAGGCRYGAARAGAGAARRASDAARAQ